MFLSWSPPHNPYHQLPARWAEVYDPAHLTLSANTADTEQHRLDLAGYYAHISALDENLGRLLDGLEERGLAENTIVVFTSDHGDMLGAHGVYRKQLPWDESTSVPLLVRCPEGLPQGQICTTPFSTEDTAPTLLSWLRIEPPETMQGRDLTAVIKGHEAAPTSSVLMSIAPFSETRGSAWRAVRTASHTFARDKSGPWLLYDNLADPDQFVNLVDDPAVATIRADLETELQGWLEQIDDPFEGAEYYLKQYGYEVEAGQSAPYTYDPVTELQITSARRRDEL